VRPAPARAGAPIGQLTAYSPRTSAAHGDAGPDSERWRSTAARTMRWRGFSSSAAASIGGAPGHAPGSPMGRSGGRGAPGASRRPSLPAHSSTNDRISWSLESGTSKPAIVCRCHRLMVATVILPRRSAHRAISSSTPPGWLGVARRRRPNQPRSIWRTIETTGPAGALGCPPSDPRRRRRPRHR